MNYFFIIIVFAICISITLFLVRESYASEKSKKISFIITIISIIVTVASIVFSNSLTRSYLIIPQEHQEQFITFDGLPCFIISKNFDDTKVNNSASEFIFYNHPNNENDHNTLRFSFNFEQKYEFFSSCITTKDSINNTNMQTTIQIYADDLLIYSSADLNGASLPFYISLSLRDISILTFIIDTCMINTNEELFRTITFSDTTIE